MSEITRILDIQGTAIIKCSPQRAEAILEDKEVREKKLAKLLESELGLDDIRVEIHDFLREEEAHGETD